MGQRKTIRIDVRAEKEIAGFPRKVQIKLLALLEILKFEGKLEEPYGKKIDGELLEIRIKHQGQWRVLYAYWLKEYVIVLSGFQKKKQKSPLKEIHKAKKRLQEYL